MNDDKEQQKQVGSIVGLVIGLIIFFAAIAKPLERATLPHGVLITYGANFGVCFLIVLVALAGLSIE